MTNPTVTIYFGGTAADVTSDVLSVSVRRGRSRELDTFTAGGCTIRLRNDSRAYDPTYTLGAYFGYLVPRVRVTVTLGEVSFFDGFVEDWSYSFEPSGWSVATVSCLDGLALLSQTSLDAYTNQEGTPSERIQAALDRPTVAYAGDVDLDPGYTLLQADTVSEGTNTVQYLQTVAATDFGRLFVDGSGTLRYRDRTDGVTGQPLVIFGATDDLTVQRLGLLSEAVLWFDATSPRPLRIDDAAIGQTVLQDATLWFDATDPAYVAPVIDFNAVEVEYGSEFLYNRIVVTRAGGTAQTASDAASITAYGIRAYDASGLLFQSDAAAALFADYLASVYAQPAVRVARHDLTVTGLSDLHANYVRRLEIGDLVRTIWTPSGIGTALDIVSFVEGVEHTFTPGLHQMTLQLTPLTSDGGFILDSAASGVLDTSELTY